MIPSSSNAYPEASNEISFEISKSCWIISFFLQYNMNLLLQFEFIITFSFLDTLFHVATKKKSRGLRSGDREAKWFFHPFVLDKYWFKIAVLSGHHVGERRLSEATYFWACEVPLLVSLADHFAQILENVALLFFLVVLMDQLMLLLLFYVSYHALVFCCLNVRYSCVPKVCFIRQKYQTKIIWISFESSKHFSTKSFCMLIILW